MLGLSSASNFDIATGATASKTGLNGGAGGGLAPNLASIIASVKNDIKSLRTQLDNIPGLTKGSIPLSSYKRYRCETTFTIGKVLKQPWENWKQSWQ